MAKHTESLVERGHIGDHASGSTTRDGRLVGFGESHGRGRAAAADLNPDGTITLQIAGNPPQGEDGTLECCIRLITTKRLAGESWENPGSLQREGYVDAVSTSPDCSQNLKIQVVRAFVEQGFWHTLKKAKVSSVNLFPSGAADLLRDAINSKVEKIPFVKRQGILLLLDATDVPALVLTNVVDAFHKAHGDWCEKQGFSEVWIAGPWQEMTYRLDRA